jgi:hypothetical protein
MVSMRARAMGPVAPASIAIARMLVILTRFRLGAARARKRQNSPADGSATARRSI